MNPRAVAALVAAVLATLAAAAPAPAARPIRMSGQQITQVLVADLAYFYRHHDRRAPRFELTGGGTGAGLADTARGISDAALVSRELTPDDPPGLVLTRLARSGVCLASHNTNPIPSLSRALLQDIVAARVTSWSQVPGSARSDPIVPVALDPGTGAARVFEQVFLDDATPQDWQPVTLLTSLQARDYLERTPAAFAYLDLAFTQPVHPIPYEGVPCTRATVRDGSYPAARASGRRHPRAPQSCAAPVPALGADQPHRPPRDRHPLRPDRPRPLTLQRSWDGGGFAARVSSRSRGMSQTTRCWRGPRSSAIV